METFKTERADLLGGEIPHQSESTSGASTGLRPADPLTYQFGPSAGGTAQAAIDKGLTDLADHLDQLSRRNGGAHLIRNAILKAQDLGLKPDETHGAVRKHLQEHRDRRSIWWTPNRFKAAWENVAIQRQRANQ